MGSLLCGCLGKLGSESHQRTGFIILNSMQMFDRPSNCLIAFQQYCHCICIALQQFLKEVVRDDVDVKESNTAKETLPIE